MVLQRNTTSYTASNVTLEYGAGTIDVEADSVTELQAYMREEFYENNPVFAEGSGLTVKYGFVTFDEGSQLGRYMLGGLAGGEAKMVIRAEFFDAAGNSLSAINAEGTISGGFFGGDAGSGLRGAAKEIAAYAAANFAR